MIKNKKEPNLKITPEKPYLSKGNNLPVITSIFLTIIMILIIIVVYTIYISKLKSILNTEMRPYIKELNSQSINSINKQVHGRIELLEALAISIGEENPINIQRALSTLNKENENGNFKRMGIILPNGKSYTSDGYTQDFSDRTSFKKALNGTSNVSDVLVDKVDGENIIVHNAPIYNGDKVIGVVFATNSISLYRDTISVPTFEGAGVSYILKSDSTLITNSNISSLNTNKDGSLSKDNENSTLNNKHFDTMKENMKKGVGGTLEYKLSGTDVYMTYEPIGLNDWYLLSTIPSEILIEKSKSLNKISFYIGLFIVVLFGALMIYIIIMQNKSKKALSNLAYIDPVTNSRNATKFFIDTKIILKNFKGSYALVRFDIDKFKYINDAFGYSEGNYVLKSIASILEKNLNTHEIYSRLQCDNFAILIKYENEDTIIKRLENLNDEFLKIISSSRSKYNLVVNFGICKINSNIPLNTINDMAGTTLKNIKGSHKSSIEFCDNNILDSLLNECEIENIMSSSLKNGDFKVYIQGKYTIEPFSLCGGEALIRWIHPEKGALLPNNFIPIFEKNEFIINIDLYVFEEICKLIRYWLDNNIAPVTISINHSKASLYSIDFIDSLKKIINKYDVSPKLIEIEITESTFFDNIDYLLDIMKDLKDIGFTLSIDDFGSGYSSLNLLKDIPVDVLKLDKEFFNESSNTNRGRIIISSIVSMAKSLDIKVISEGVETSEQADFLKSIGCNMIQGYLYSKPLGIEDFEKRLFKDKQN